MIAKQEVILFRVQLKYAESSVLYLVTVRIEKQDFEVGKMSKTNI